MQNLNHMLMVMYLSRDGDMDHSVGAYRMSEVAVLPVWPGV